MIPDWQGAIREAAAKLAPGGRLDIVDFGQQNGLPRLWRKLLFAWLAKFDVSPRATLRDVVEGIATRQGLEADFLPLRLGYVWVARLSRS
jgi:S-adenosylmethionine-diacylgycerolhomoserine-N-methlytransferase